MKNKIIGIFICMLFIGIGVSSAISVENNSTKSNNVSVRDCGCKTKTDDPIICDILLLTMKAIGLKLYFISELMKKYNESNYPIIFDLLYKYSWVLIGLGVYVFGFAEKIHCSWTHYPENINFQTQLKDINYLQNK